uniref:Insulin-like domain-containing protein n=1 Tax=Oryzias melastigma TaxID=30732 RepID=A0A3B3BSZ8_ORYME
MNHEEILLILLLCLLCAAHAQTQDNTNTLRLCGRAFLRALVYTCGGSRWRRLMEPEETLSAGQSSIYQKRTAAPVMDHQRRDQNQALKTMCCQYGCQRSDLSRLC